MPVLRSLEHASITLYNMPVLRSLEHASITL